MAGSAATRFGPQDKRLAELTDAELLAEVNRRRKRRGFSPEAGPASSASSSRPKTARTELAKHLASLELESDATPSDVDAAYKRLRDKYEPFLDADSRERRDAAKRLLAALKQAYEAAKQQLG